MGQQQGQGQGYTQSNYNPQPMQGNTQPFWSPYPDWNMRAGSGMTPQDNRQRAVNNTPGAPQWLQQQLGDYMNLPMYQNPGQYGRWNWGTNLQGQGTPSAFGQYAQQTATYPNLQFPPPPATGGGSQPPPTGGGAPPPTAPPVTQPPKPANLGGASDADLYQLYAYGQGGAQNAARQAVINRFGGDNNALNNWINTTAYNSGNGQLTGGNDVLAGLYSKYGLSR